MQRDNTARRSCAPENHPTLPVTFTPESAEPESTIALGQSAITRAVDRKKAIAAGAIVLIVLFYFLPTLATGLLFGAALFGINTLVDGKMGGQDYE